MIKDPYHIVLSTDTLGFPRPWQTKAQEKNQELFFRYRMTYPYILKFILSSTFQDKNVEVTNLGRRASTVENLRAVGRDLLNWMSPDIAIVHHGMADCWIRDSDASQPRTSEEKFASELRQFIDLRNERAPRLPIIFVAILRANEATLRKKPQQNDFINRYNEIIASTAGGQRGVQIVTIGDGDEDGRALVLDDGRHLSRHGHQRAALSLADAIVRAAQEAAADEQSSHRPRREGN